MRFGALPGLLLGCLVCFAATAPDVKTLPKPTGYVSDLAHVVGAQDKEQLEEFCTRVERELGVQFALVTIDSIGDTPIDRFTLDLARTWGVGAKKDNQGLLVLLAVKDRKSRVEVGRGVEPYVTDGFAGRTLRAMRPDLQGGAYGAALLEGARAMAAEVAQGKGIAFAGGGTLAPQAPSDDQPVSHGRGLPIGAILIVIFFLLFLILRLFGGGGRGGGYRGGGGGGFLTGFLLSSLLNSGGRGGGWGNSGGGGFGGDSGGGGGFGGFGGGDFGGGGASSDW